MSLEMIDLNSVLSVPQEEIDGINRVFSEYNSSIPLKFTYDNITIHEFSTDMKTNPNPVFSAVLDFAEKQIDAAVVGFSSTTVGTDSWQIKTKFLTINLCLHCYSEYDQSDFAFEDIATHRVVVSMTAYYDTKYIYRSDKCNADAFGAVNQFYIDLRTSLQQ